MDVGQAACCKMALAASAAVNSEALRDLKTLLQLSVTQAAEGVGTSGITS